nr:centrosomal protein of 290 kDa isoform X1 [Ciona intestinalis]|eukprot:XP_009861312.1 centrosomal protein of 290 kDa isoform X1 [Ciona intestinalis]
MKELNERQRADHATKMYNKLKSSLNELENRNSELDQKFSELTKMNMEAQKTERDLRDELAEVVPRSVSDADRKKMVLLQEDLVKTKLKMSKLQDIAEISRNQLQSVQSQQQARDRELKSLRQQLKTFQHQTDNNALIGQLHHQVLTLQASESDLERKLSNTRQDVIKLKAKLFKAEKLTDEKEDAVYLTRAECNTKIRNLRKTIQSLRQQFSGALPISQQEKFAKTMIRLRGDKKLVEEEMRKMRIEREKLEDQLLEAEVRKKGLEDLRRAIEDKRGADQLTEWCRKMDGLRLKDMKLQRQVTRQNEQISYMERLNNQHENTISSLEEDIVQMLKVQEDHQVEWESRESELERLLDQFQNQQREVNKRAKKLDDFSEILPQTSLSVEDQLKKALETIKEQRKTMTNLQAQVKNLEFESDRLKDARHALEGDITSRDRIINELRLHMPTTVVLPEPHTTDNESKQQLDVAINTIETLKKRLSAKEQSIERYKELLEESRRDHEMMSAAHERDLLLMQNKIHVKTDDAFNKFKQAATSASQPPGSSAPSASDLRHLNELEDMVREQDAAMSALMERVRSSNADISRHKRALLDTKKQHEAEKMKMQETHDVMLNALRMKLAKKHKQVEATTTELSVTKEELKRQKDANTRAPAASMKNLVQRLKEELAEKEKQQQQLSHALKELRVDLVQQAQENVRAATAGEADTHNVTILVEKRTAHYKDDIEDLKDEIAQLRRNLKQSEKTETTLKSELRKTLEEAEKKSQVIQRLKSDLHTKETESKDLREKMKRLLRNKGPDAGIKFGEDQPLKIKLSEGRKVEEDEIKPVDAGTKNLSRPSSASSKLPRSVYSSQDGEKNEKLKSEIVNLKREVENLKEKLKKKTEIPDKTTLEVAKWDVKKQWQSKVESLKSKLQDAEKQVTAQDKQIAALRVANSRLEKEKLRKPVIPLNQYTDDAAPPNGLEVKQHLHTIEELSSRLHDLGEENSDLKKMTTLPKNKLITEMQMKNQHLSNQMQDLQKELLTAGLRHETDETLASQFEDRENRMQGRILQLASENTQFQFEIEQIKHDVPRLQERVEFQQRFINLLKSEKAELQQRVDKLLIQRKGPDVGGSGKNIQELEKTVVLMKKVVERVQRENEDLKKAPGVVSNQLLEQLKSENQLLKNRINEMTQQIGGQLSLRYESKTQSVEKLMKENEKLRKDLNKNATTRDRIRDSKQVLQAEYNKLTKDFEEVKKKLTVAESKAPKFAGSGSKGYNSAITSRMLESKLRKTEADLEKKTKEVGGLKDVLEDQRMQENKLNKDVERLQEQVEVLERFPLGAGGSDPNTVRELQLTRLTVARLENEKEELNHLIKTANQKLRNHGLDENGPSTSEQEKEINTTKAENVRLGTEMLILRKENEKLTQDIERMREELSHFDGEFFDEIEDLKYNYSECIKKNVAYEEQLRALSQQFGVAFEIPSSDD